MVVTHNNYFEQPFASFFTILYWLRITNYTVPIMRMQLFRTQNSAAGKCLKIANLKGVGQGMRSFPEYIHDIIDFLGLTASEQSCVDSANRKTSR